MAASTSLDYRTLVVQIAVRIVAVDHAQYGEDLGAFTGHVRQSTQLHEVNTALIPGVFIAHVDEYKSEVRERHNSAPR